MINDYTPATGDRFQLLVFGGRNGDFAAYSLPDLGGTLYLDPNYDDNSLTLVTKPAG